MISESKTGYVLDFEVYAGAKKDTQSTGYGYQVVMDLTEQYQHKGHRLFIDNFYMSPQLLVNLLSKGTYYTGTTKNRTMFPKELIPDTTMELGSFSFVSAENPKELLTVCWC